jgi:hypothetical protein
MPRRNVCRRAAQIRGEGAVNLVEYFEMRQQESQERKERLRRTIADFGRAAENLRRISSNQK